MTATAARPSLPRRLPRAVTAVIAVFAVVFASLAAGAADASAAPTTEYELKGEWTDDASTPTTTGGILGARWFYNVNDANPDPQNPDHENLTITFTTANAVFTEMPESCVADGDPVSEISADGTQLICNFGTRPLGTAEVALAGLKVTGPTGDFVTLDATIGEGDNAVAADVPDRLIQNPFMLELKADEGVVRVNMPEQFVYMTFPWSIRHAAGSPEGPSEVTYRFNVSNNNGDQYWPTAGNCSPLGHEAVGYPYSEPSFEPERTTNFPTCSLSRLSGNTFELTISGLDYSAPYPTHDSTGGELPSEWDVIASGVYNIGYAFPGRNDTTTVQFNRPTYEAVDGQTYRDDGADNTAVRWVAPGWYSSAWALGATNDRAYGAPYLGTWKTVEGSQVVSRTGARLPLENESVFAACTIYDTKYATFDRAEVGRFETGPGDEQVFVPVDGVQYRYFVGNGPGGILDPNNANYNPNAFGCEEGGAANWVDEPPADLSQVKAVRARIEQSVSSTTKFNLFSWQTLTPEAQPGQDVWVWSSRYVSGEWVNPARSMNPNDAPPDQRHPDARYPYAMSGRDILWVVAGYPLLTKAAEPEVAGPGENVTYTLTHQVESPVGSYTADDGVITDTLPPDVTYVPGSASVEPTSVDGQTLTWELDGLTANTEYVIIFEGTLGMDVAAGSTVTNSAAMSFEGMTDESSAETIIREGGYTSLVKAAAEQQIPHLDGVASGEWTVSLTSHDATPQTFTDVIDILPYNEDGRGTSFNGSYALSGPVTGYGTVYYTTTDPTTLVDDPADASNGAPGDVTGNTVGWSTTFDPDATAVRVIGGTLRNTETATFTVPITTTGAVFEDIYVNRAEARASHTELKMRTSSWLQVAASNSVLLKKYVQDADGEWHDAQDIADYPSYPNNSEIPYRLVVTNTGDQTLTDVALTDDQVDLASLNIPGLEPGAIIAELLPGEENAKTFEYTVEADGKTPGELLINNACASADGVDESCDPAGVEFAPGALTWEKVAAGTTERLSGSEWELQLLDAEGDPVGDPIVVVDCGEVPCEGADANPESGVLTVGDLQDGEYLLTETKAPAGYVLLLEPVVVEVDGITEIDAPIENDQAPAVAIPFTGGMASDAFAIGASGLMALAGVAYIVRRRKRADA